jgi:hypothetical protein
MEPEAQFQVQVRRLCILPRMEEVAGKREEDVQPAGEAVQRALEAARRTGVQ